MSGVKNLKKLKVNKKRPRLAHIKNHPIDSYLNEPLNRNVVSDSYRSTQPW